MNRGVCYIIGAGDTPESRVASISSEDVLICADGGGAYAQKLLGREADYILGDFDSLGYVPHGKGVIVAPAEKDETDMMLAVDKGFALGYKSFVLYGALGGERADHSVANIQLLHYIAEKGSRGFIVHGNRVFTAIKNSSITLSPALTGYISVFSMTDKSEGVTIKGLKYELENATLYSHKPIGVSNEFIGKEGLVKVEYGVLLISYQMNNE